MNIEEYLNRFLPDNGSPMSGLNNVKVNTIIFTHNRHKAENRLNVIYNENKNNVRKYLKGKDDLQIWLNDGLRFIWVKPNRAARGYRCAKAIIDQDITLKELQDNIIGCLLYCGKSDVTFF